MSNLVLKINNTTARSLPPTIYSQHTNRLGGSKTHDLTFDFFDLGEGEDITDVQVTVEDLL